MGKQIISKGMTKKMKILVTGAKGFIGKNLVATLNNIQRGTDKSFDLTEDIILYEYDAESDTELLDKYCSDCDFVFNLSGVNRTKQQSEFMQGNYEATSVLLDLLKKHNNKSPVVMSSSIQAVLDNPYGKSKKAGEGLMFAYGEETGVPVYVYRFSNIFGKWCRPNYNSVVATFCNNIANDLSIQVNDSATEINLIYIDDVVTELINALKGKPHVDDDGYCYVPCVHLVTLGKIVELLYSFKESRNNRRIPDMTEGGFSKKLYATYLSYLPTAKFKYPLQMNVDERGSFTEILKTVDRGQFSVNISKPGTIKGEHWHHTKNEKFIVVSGKGLVQLRKIGSSEIINYHVSGEKIEVVDIPAGYIHNIINEGDTDLITFMWCSECFDPENPDTYSLKVKE